MLNVQFVALALNVGVVIVSLTVLAAKAASLMKSARTTSFHSGQSARFENGLPAFLVSRAILVVVMGSLSGGANKLSTGSDLTESLSCPGNLTHLPAYINFPWSHTVRALPPRNTPRNMAT